MKRTDDINAKLDIWAASPRVTPLLRLTNLPRLGHKKFNSHAELNRWKQSLLAELAAHGGAQWTKCSGVLPPMAGDKTSHDD